MKADNDLDPSCDPVMYGPSGVLHLAYHDNYPVQLGPMLNAYRKEHAINALTQEGRDLHKADVGTLTAEHHAYLLAKLNVILAGNF